MTNRNAIVSALSKLTAAVARRSESASVMPELVRHTRFFFFPTCRQEISLRLQTLNQSISECYQRTDAEFMGLARALRHLHDTAKALADLVGSRLGSVRTALDESRISGDNGLAAAALQDLQEGLAEAADELTELRAIGGHLQKLRTQVDNIDRIGVSVRASVFGFAVESARSVECQQTFSSFISELRTLSNKITLVTNAISDHSAVTRHSQEQKWRNLSDGHGRLCGLAEDLKVAAVATANEAQAILDRVLAGLQQAEAHMSRIMKHVDEAIYYIQFGDIVRQKTDHIIAALREAGEHWAQTTSRKSFISQAAAADHVISIQIGQLELVRQEVEAAQRKLADSFHSLTGEACELQGMLGQWHESKNQQEGQSESIQAFKSDLMQLEHLHRQGQELRTEARQTADSAASAARELACHMKDVKSLNQDIHLLALNAIVKTAALGNQGSTLAVLSMHVDSLYRESRHIAGEVAAILEAILEGANAAGRDRDVPVENPRTAHIHNSMEKVEAACDACRAAFSSAEKLISQQKEALKSSQAMLDFLGEHVLTIGGQIRDLTNFRRELEPWLAGRETAGQTAAAVLHHRYTMQSERDIHEAALRETANVEAASSSSGDPPRLERQRTQLRGDSAPVPEIAANNSNQTEPALAKAGLGDNVELF